MKPPSGKPRPTVRGVLRSSHPRSSWAGSLLDGESVQPPSTSDPKPASPTPAEAIGPTTDDPAQGVARAESEGGRPEREKE